MYIADMLSGAYLHEKPSTSKTDYQLFHTKSPSVQRIEEIDPAKVRLSLRGLANLREATIKG